MTTPICSIFCGDPPGAAGGGGVYSATQISTAGPFTVPEALIFLDGTISRLFQLLAGDVIRVGVAFAPLDAGVASVTVALSAEKSG